MVKQTLWDRVKGVSPSVSVASRPGTPDELATQMIDYDQVVSMRLHGCITPIALGIPAFGLYTDAKVGTFYVDLGAPETVSPVDREPLDDILQQLSVFVANPTIPEGVGAARQAILESVNFLSTLLPTRPTGGTSKPVGALERA